MILPGHSGRCRVAW